MPTLTKNYGLAGGTLNASKHVALAAEPAKYMRRLAERPWAKQQMDRRTAASFAAEMVGR